jgi:two-component system response regulator QseB
VTTLKTARDAAPDLILLDLGLPGGDGFIVMERLKTVDALAFVPVVVISARDPRVSEQAALDAGAVAFLAKPIDVDELLDVVRATLG